MSFRIAYLVLLVLTVLVLSIYLYQNRRESFLTSETEINMQALPPLVNLSRRGYPSYCR